MMRLALLMLLSLSGCCAAPARLAADHWFDGCNWHVRNGSMEGTTAMACIKVTK